MTTRSPRRLYRPAEQEEPTTHAKRPLHLEPELHPGSRSSSIRASGSLLKPLVATRPIWPACSKSRHRQLPNGTGYPTRAFSMSSASPKLIARSYVRTCLSVEDQSSDRTRTRRALSRRCNVARGLR